MCVSIGIFADDDDDDDDDDDGDNGDNGDNSGDNGDDDGGGDGDGDVVCLFARVSLFVDLSRSVASCLGR